MDIFGELLMVNWFAHLLLHEFHHSKTDRRNATQPHIMVRGSIIVFCWIAHLVTHISCRKMSLPQIPSSDQIIRHLIWVGGWGQTRDPQNRLGKHQCLNVKKKTSIFKMTKWGISTMLFDYEHYFVFMTYSWQKVNWKARPRSCIR